MKLPLEIKYKILELLPFNKVVCLSDYISMQKVKSVDIYVFIEQGDLGVIKWLHANDLLPVDDILLSVIENGGKLDILKWLHENNIGRCTKFTLASAYDCPDESILFLHDNYKICSSSLVDRLCYNRRLNLVEELIDCCRCTHNAISTACFGGDLDIIELVYDKCTTKEDNFITAAAMSGHLNVVIYLYVYKNEEVTHLAMDYAAESGHLHVVKWLHENTNADCTTRAIDMASMFGHFQVVKFLVEQKKECSRYAFVHAKTQEISDFLEANVRTFKPYEDHSLWMIYRFN